MKRPPEPFEIAMWNARPRPSRRTTPQGASPAPPPRRTAKDKKCQEDLFAREQQEKEAENHRQAIQEYHARCCRSSPPWVCAEALLYLVDGSKIVKRHALWLFPSDQERYLVHRAPDGTEELYVLVRLEGKNCLDKLSLGVQRTSGDYTHAGTTTSLDPTEGQVVRIVSIEDDVRMLVAPENANFLLDHARHMQQVIAKQESRMSGGAPTDTLHYKFATLRTSEYLEAHDVLQSDNCEADKWEAALHTVETNTDHPWKLANRVVELGAMDVLDKAETSLLSQGRVHVVDDIWVVDESLPLQSIEFLCAARWAVQKAKNGTGSIPKAKMWEPVVMLNHADKPEFHLMRMA